MRTTLDLDKNLVEEARKITGEKNKSKAVNKVLEEYIRRKRIDELKALAGNIDIIDNLDELEALEIREMKELYGDS